jgi:hypothetical protein
MTMPDMDYDLRNRNRQDLPVSLIVSREHGPALLRYLPESRLKEAILYPRFYGASILKKIYSSSGKDDRLNLEFVLAVAATDFHVYIRGNVAWLAMSRGRLVEIPGRLPLGWHRAGTVYPVPEHCTKCGVFRL